MLAQLLSELTEFIPELAVVELGGGDKRNALAREAFAKVLVSFELADHLYHTLAFVLSSGFLNS